MSMARFSLVLIAAALLSGAVQAGAARRAGVEPVEFEDLLVPPVSLQTTARGDGMGEWTVRIQGSVSIPVRGARLVVRSLEGDLQSIPLDPRPGKPFLVELPVHGAADTAGPIEVAFEFERADAPGTVHRELRTVRIGEDRRGGRRAGDKVEEFPAFPCTQDSGTATGTSTITGTISYKNPSGGLNRCTYCKVDLRDFDDWGPGDEALGTVYTDINGNFSATIQNLDTDIGGKVDLYLRIWTTNPGKGTVKMTNGQVYGYQTGMKRCNVPNGAVALGSINLDTNGNWSRAFRAFRIVGLSWYEAKNNAGTQGIDTGPLTVIFPADGWTSSLGQSHSHDANAAHYHDSAREAHIGSGRLESNDVAMFHETGHHVMTAVGYPLLSSSPACHSTNFFAAATATDCAWREGWAEYWAAEVSNLTVLTRGAGSSFNIETYTCNGTASCGSATGPNVPGRIAAALHDARDSVSDGLDQHTSSLSTVFHVFRESRNLLIAQLRDFQNYYFWWDGLEYPPANLTQPAKQNTITLP